MPAWIQILIRSAAMFLTLLICFRLINKRSFTRAEPYRFVSYMAAAFIAALISVGLIANMILGLISLGVWILLPLAFDFLSLKSKLFHDLVNGKETVLIKHGKIMEENLQKLRLTGEELLHELRSKNAFSLADVEFAVMESTGEVNVLLKSDKKPVTAHDLGEMVAPTAEPQTIILDGSILDESLSSLGLSRQWLDVQLESMGVSLDNVFVGQVDSSGDLYLDLFDDAVQLPQPKVKEMLYASLEKCQADLTAFSLETEDKRAKKMYTDDADKVNLLLNKLKPYLLR